ncbi:MAG: D-glycerate dehydrogenase, partial [Marinovum sp.]|nr:D-glycerate dehydrogenase [Marinovum sp.]
MAKPRVLVTRRWPVAVEAQLQDQYDVVLNTHDKPLTPSEFRAALTVYDAVLPTVTDLINADAMDIPKAQTKILANYGVGYSHIDAAAAKDLNIMVTNTPDVLSECTADLAMT